MTLRKYDVYLYRFVSSREGPEVDSTMLAMTAVSIAALFLSVVRMSGAYQCSCAAGGVDNGRKLSTSTISGANIKRVIFTPVTSDGARGEKYSRVKEASKLHAESSSNTNTNCNAEQIHISFGNDDNSVVISFASFIYGYDGIVQYSSDLSSFTSGDGLTNVTASSQSYSEIMYYVSNLYDPAMGTPMGNATHLIDISNTASWAYDKQTGTPWANYKQVTKVSPGTILAYNNPYVIYDSPVVFTASIGSLTPGKTYYYNVVGHCQVYSFTMPQSHTYPLTVGLVVDIGQTEVCVKLLNCCSNSYIETLYLIPYVTCMQVSVASMHALKALNVSVLLLPGDLSYADGYPSLWDSFANTMEPLLATTLTLTTGGNHEIGSSEAWQSYKARYPTPHEASGSSNFCYYGREVGVMHVIVLCSYAGFAPSSLQYKWLIEYLGSSIDREKTPWVVAMFHAPFYNSNQGHWMEAELMRIAIEPILYKYGVDMVLSGHIHAYERSLPVYNYTANECGTTYLNIGDGGNYEGTYTDWWPLNSSFGGGNWSAFREASFGVGEMVIHNSTHASFAWHRHACQSDQIDYPHYSMNFTSTCISEVAAQSSYDGTASYDTSAQAMLTSDTFWVVRPNKTVCPNKYYSTSTSSSTPSSSTPSSSSSDAKLTGMEKALIALCVIFAVATCVLAGLLGYGYKKYVRVSHVNSDG